MGRVCDFVSAAFMNVPIKPTAPTKTSAAVAASEIVDEEDKGFEVVEDETALVKKKTQKGPAGGY